MTVRPQIINTAFALLLKGIARFIFDHKKGSNNNYYGVSMKLIFTVLLLLSIQVCYSQTGSQVTTYTTEFGSVRELSFSTIFIY